VTHESDLKGALKNANGSAATTPSAKPAAAPTKSATPPAADGSDESATFGSADDYQLARAVDMLRGLALFGPKASTKAPH
jgi:carboxyl-terminal processing protease